MEIPAIELLCTSTPFLFQTMYICGVASCTSVLVDYVRRCSCLFPCARVCTNSFHKAVVNSVEFSAIDTVDIIQESPPKEYLDIIQESPPKEYLGQHVCVDVCHRCVRSLLGTYF
ncbi:hypothetical protein KP509_37G062000 [Ceratopteris richardii]|uniref:Uncharacterized protein n=1 Tax=Ceratopteris richardii TaxID=49495 RepID=A0A8T2Q8N0_CERRI|nr:hypothetical protein KP509_37G062000 [Ceratopteris richardii]